MPNRFRAPGRVNLIGEHTDYNQGFVLPIAIDLACTVTTEPAPEWTVTSRQFGETCVLSENGVPGERKRGHWTDYVLGVVREFGSGRPPLHLTVDSAVPVGSGLSSSASLEVSLALACLEGQPIPPMELVRRVHQVETDFIGLPCGIMDQYISVFGRLGHAVLIDCRSQQSHLVPLPAGVEYVVINTMVKHALATSAYATRVAECAADAAALGVTSLREAVISGGRPRARHIISENARVLEFVAACERGDLAAMGQLMFASHLSLREDYEVSCPELDFLVDQAAQFPGVYGARMTGGGFGGCAIALVNAGDATAFEQTITDAYQGRFGRTPGVYRVTPSDGAA
ncbi:MAG: galactokinase [Acidobacteria bacterium]|nr:galactokinase [Acidobacteriota bacterium]